MTPRLIVLEGPLEGAVVPLIAPETSIGREPSNHVCLDAPAVSRHHCSIMQDGQEFTLHDRGSLNHTSVNGAPVKEHRLKNGDRIRVGDTLLLFSIEDDAGKRDQVQINTSGVDVKNTLQLNREDALRFETSERSLPAVRPSRSTRDLNALLKISLTINSIHELEPFGEQLLSLIFEVIPAARGAILLVEENSEEFSSVFGHHRPAGEKERARSAGTIRISRTVADRVLREGVAIVCNDVMGDDDLRQAASLAVHHIQALLAVPLTVGDKTLGLIYLDAYDPTAEFDKDHLQFMRAIAAVAAVALENIRQVNRLKHENRRLQAEISIEHDMVGDSPRMNDVYKFIAKVAPTNSTVLIAGESGVGKELAARALHQNSPRAKHPFVAINCAALTESLLESELFGHEKGAFTGAVTMKKGKLELAQHGSVFLDEIGEMALPLQAKILRVLQQRQFERVGGVRVIEADIRLIAATNRNMEEAIKTGAFREDLFYRLNVIRLNMPPLRERREDIPPLAAYFAEKYSRQCHRQIRGISAEAQNCLLQYDWPGNVREFENAIERAVVLGSTDVIQIEDLPESVIETAPSVQSGKRGFYEAVKEAKKQLILDAFEQAHGSYNETAALLGMHPNHLHRMIRNLDMKGELKRM
jgi:transcriptional regulator with GAF, ATPase, and Fis domain